MAFSPGHFSEAELEYSSPSAISCWHSPANPPPPPPLLLEFSLFLTGSNFFPSVVFWFNPLSTVGIKLCCNWLRVHSHRNQTCLQWWLQSQSRGLELPTLYRDASFQAKAWIQALAVYFQAICIRFFSTNWTILDSFQAHSCFLTGNPAYTPGERFAIRLSLTMIIVSCQLYMFTPKGK